MSCELRLRPDLLRPDLLRPDRLRPDDRLLLLRDDDRRIRRSLLPDLRRLRLKSTMSLATSLMDDTDDTESAPELHDCSASPAVPVRRAAAVRPPVLFVDLRLDRGLVTKLFEGVRLSLMTM